MIIQRSTILLPSGLHIYNVAKLKEIIDQTECLAFIRFKGKTTNINDIAGVLALGLKKGDDVTVLVDGLNEDKVSQRILNFLTNKNIEEK